MIETARTRVRHAASWLKRRAIEAIDRRYGVSTSDFVYLDDLSLPIENRVWHDPSDWFALRRALRRLHIGRDDVFVDYGSGLGRAVLIAATLPFRRVMGVELAREMTEIARANVQRNQRRLRASAVEFVVSDATAWEMPPDVTVAYFYCPFTGDIFERVIANLLASVDRHPRPLRLVYNYPVEHSYLIRTGRVTVLDVVSNQPLPRSRKTGEVIVTYLVLPSDPVLQREYRARFAPRVRDREWLGEYEPGFVLEKPARLGGVFLRRPKLSV
jgi:hypothetical protein